MAIEGMAWRKEDGERKAKKLETNIIYWLYQYFILFYELCCFSLFSIGGSCPSMDQHNEKNERNNAIHKTE